MVIEMVPEISHLTDITDIYEMFEEDGGQIFLLTSWFVPDDHDVLQRGCKETRKDEITTSEFQVGLTQVPDDIVF